MQNLFELNAIKYMRSVVFMNGMHLYGNIKEIAISL